MEECIPKVTLSSRPCLPWLTKNILQLIRQRNLTYKTCGNHKVQTLRNKVTSMLRTAKKRYFSNLNISDQKHFWKALKKLVRNHSSIPVLSYNNTSAFTSQDKADVLSVFFKRCFNHSVEPLSFADLDTYSLPLSGCPEEFLCTVEEVQMFLFTLDTTKSTSPDGISARMLKSVPSITWLLNFSILFSCYVASIPYCANTKINQ